MELITAKYKDETLTLYPHSRIDSSNAGTVQTLSEEFIAQYKPVNLIVDADDLEYLSSAGLRVILKFRKAFPNLKVIGTSSEVYDIFEMTGFTEMITVERGYRKLSVDGCEVIGKGANGTVYRLDSDTIIKVYADPEALPDIQRERELARRAFVLGVPTAIPYDVVKVGNLYGSVFELLNAKSLANLLCEDPSGIDRYVDMSVDILKIIHATDVLPEDMPDMKEIALDWVNFLKTHLPEDTWSKLHSLVKAVPDSLRMIHGDYHVKNVMVQNSEALLIDMDTLCHGDPVFEFASIFNAYKGFYMPDQYLTPDAGSFLGIPADSDRLFYRKTLEQYFGTTDDALLKQIEDKAALIGYTRLMRRLIRRHGLENEAGKKAIDYYRKEIIRLAAQLDTIIL